MSAHSVTRPSVSPYLVLFFGILAVSTAAILIRWAQEASVSSLVISGGRLLVATLALTPITLSRYAHELRGLDRRDLMLCLISGIFLAMHFAAWITSLEYTSVVASVVLVTTNPLWVAVLSVPLLGERVTRQVMTGIALAFMGGVVIAFSGDAGEAPTRAAPLLGNGLAALGALTIAFYFIIGRRLRAKLSVFTYIWLVYGTAGVLLIPVILLSGESVTHYSIWGYVWVVALGLIPQLVGHSSFNYALGYLPAAYVSTVALAEPVGSGILAIFLLGEVPGVVSVVGSIIILGGIAIATRTPHEPKTQVEQSADVL